MHTALLLLAVWSSSVGLVAQDPPPDERTTTLRIRAKVCDAEGRPLATGGLVIGPSDEVTTAMALKQPMARCDEHGVVEYVVARPQSRFAPPVDLLLAAPGKVALVHPSPFFRYLWGLDPQATALDLGEVRLPDGVTLTGRVIDAQGEPVAGARVRALDCLSTYPWRNATYGSQVRTNARGVFVLPGVFGRAMQITVTAPGYFDKSIASVSVGNPLDIELRASGFVDGFVRDLDGEPVGGFVMATYELLDSRPTTIDTADGSFRLGIAHDCRFRITAYDRKSGASAESRLLHGPATAVEVRFEQPGEQSFLVTAVDDETGAAVAPIQASVIWFGGDLDDNLRDMLRWQLWPSGPDGSVELGPPAQESRQKGTVHVTADGYAPLFAQNVQWQQNKKYVAGLVRESRIAGRVVDAGGQPLVGAEVSCERVRSKRSRRGSAVVLTRTARDGSFAFGSLGEGPCELSASRPGTTAHAMKRVTLKPCETRSDLQLTVPEGVTVSGRITGAALPPACRVVLAREDVSTREQPWGTGDGVLEASNVAGVALVDGAFRFAHRGPGKEQLYLLVPLPPRHGSALRIPLSEVNVAAQDVALEVDVSSHLPGAVKGKVSVHGPRIPYGRLVVVTVPLTKRTLEWDEQIRSQHWALAETDGAFRVPAAPGSHAIEVIDAATGVTLSRTEPVIVKPGRDTESDLRVDVVEAKIRIEPEHEARLNARRLQIRVGDGPRYGRATLFAGGGKGSPGVELDGVAGTVHFFAPPGPVELRVDVGASWIRRGSVGWSSEQPHAKTTFEATFGEVHEETIRLPEPAEFDK